MELIRGLRVCHGVQYGIENTQNGTHVFNRAGGTCNITFDGIDIGFPAIGDGFGNPVAFDGNELHIARATILLDADNGGSILL